jgi:YD repeat-containing protein
MFSCTSIGCKWDAWVNYSQCKAQARVNYVNCLRNKTANFISLHNSAKAGADAELKPVLELQDRYQNPVIEATVWKNNKLASATYNKYGFIGSNVYSLKSQIIPLNVLSATFTASAGTNTVITKDSRYTDEANIKYDNGNVVEVTGKDGIITSYIWGYNQQYPVAKIVGKTIADALAQSGIIVSVVNNPATTDAAMRTELNKLRTMTGCFVTTYTYKLITGISSETDPNGKTIYYEYDAMNRLSIVKDQDGNTVRKICYTFNGQVENCSGQTYYNTVLSQVFTRNNCPLGNTGGSVTYTVPANTFSSIISQADAQAKAQNDINTNGQNYANANGTCTVTGTSITIQSNNYVAASGFTAVYTNTATSQQYSFTIPATAGLQNIGSLLPGTYNLTISKPGNTFVWIFGSGCNGSSVSGTSAAFFNISVSATNCNTILVDGF